MHLNASTARTSHCHEPMRRTLVTIAGLVMLVGCRAAPSRQEALQAYRSFAPGVDSSAVLVRVWADGPAWYSCAEVAAKLRSLHDRANVGEPLRPWRSLVLAGVATLRDTAAAPVVEPGWCVATLRDSTARLASGWRRVSGDTLPSGGRRRGWDVLAGTRLVGIADGPRHSGSDSATVRYRFTTAANANGVAVGADRDSVVRVALLIKAEGLWKVVRMEGAR